MTSTEIYQFACLGDNYGYLVHDPETGATGSIDAPDADAVMQALGAKGWKLSHILNTHHHYDHTDGNLELKQKTGCVIIGAALDKDRIPGLDVPVHEGGIIRIGRIEIQVLETPGHTPGHICFYLANDHAIFTGDTLFSLGCGRLFGDSPENMWKSLQKLMALPPQTRIYCAHEYTLSNAEFACDLEPGNKELADYMEQIKAMRREGKPTIPSSMQLELRLNPFLRSNDPVLKKSISMGGVDAATVFTEIRRAKDSF